MVIFSDLNTRLENAVSRHADITGRVLIVTACDTGNLAQCGRATIHPVRVPTPSINDRVTAARPGYLVAVCRPASDTALTKSIGSGSIKGERERAVVIM